MKRRTAFAGIAGASSVLAVAALVSPVVTNAATPTSRSSAATHVASTSSVATATRTPHLLTSTRAAAIVRKQVPGGHVTDVHRLRHGGYDAFAVRIARTDGSTLTGYIDRDSGVIFDWKQKAAPVTSTATEPSSAKGDDDTESTDGFNDDQQGDDESDAEDASEGPGDLTDDQGDLNDDHGGDDQSEHDD